MSTSSPSDDTHPGTPWHDDDEQAPLLRPGDIDRTPYSGAHRPYNFASLAYCLFR